MLALRRTVATSRRAHTRLYNSTRTRQYSEQAVPSTSPAPAAEAEHRQVVQQTQTPTSVAPKAARPPPQDDGLYWTALGLLLLTPPIMWFYYQHRKEHMGKKKEEILQKLAERRAAFQAEQGK